ncbi:MAG: flagellar basal body rod protein FlgC [Thiotrichales bacterium]|nr:flagellar basal body rod protein FlgC [Thiotrichales bacterium]MBT3613917.1 flagellar basal body rod protein FlgC [Thiotrichales bacterium]MBT3752219.1 flagellar basal body rod protein FlgC [Thiotrichales bacterium]MBT3836857.1 flagellar basal body rod protein FlgC [Thiotrichales bacterium]MBT4151789.1 flagellar basal body rod protein FlgC [Thiotrichales bacterium]
MPLFNVFDISSSALHAQNVRLNTVASNLANAETVASSEAEAYRAKAPVFQEILGGLGEQNGEEAGGVRVKEIAESQAPIKQRYAPNHPMANGDGFIFTTNVNPVEEMANMMSASRSYESSIEVMNTTKQLLMRTLNMGN